MFSFNTENKSQGRILLHQPLALLAKIQLFHEAKVLILQLLHGNYWTGFLFNSRQLKQVNIKNVDHD